MPRGHQQSPKAPAGPQGQPALVPTPQNPNQPQLTAGLPPCQLTLGTGFSSLHPALGTVGGCAHTGKHCPVPVPQDSATLGNTEGQGTMSCSAAPQVLPLL